MTLPTEVLDTETLVRCLCSPFHFKNGKLLWKAFQPPRQSDEVSVIRANHVSADFCKLKGKELADETSNPPKVYEGLAVIAAGAVRFCGSRVVDSREVYEGHADIRHGRVALDHEPPSPKEVEAIREQCKLLLRYAQFISDPDATSDVWTGPQLIAQLAVP